MKVSWLIQLCATETSEIGPVCLARPEDSERSGELIADESRRHSTTTGAIVQTAFPLPPFRDCLLAFQLPDKAEVLVREIGRHQNDSPAILH